MTRRLGYSLHWLVVLCALGCGPAGPRTRSALDAARLELAQRLNVAERAPDLWLPAQRALASANRAGDDEAARSEYETQARLWLEAAITECARADLQAERLVVERAIEESYRAASRDSKLASELSDAAAWRRSARAVRDEAEAALERAATVPARRPKLEPADERRAAEALLERAHLVALAAEALGADASALSKLRESVDGARAALARKPAQALELADGALSSALALAGDRARGDGPTDAEKASLAESIETAGASLARDDRGLLAVIDGALAASGTLSFSGRRKLGRLCALAQGHPHGPVRLTVTARTDASARRAQASLTRELDKLGCAGTRFGVDGRLGSETGLELVFARY